MDTAFLAHVETLRPKLEHLLAMVPVRPLALPQDLPRAGVYVFSESGRHLYVGRSNAIARRIGGHCRPNATHHSAAFAFRLAREATGNLRAAYQSGANSRAGLMRHQDFASAFIAAKARIGSMDLRCVEERDPVRQALLEIYVSVVLATPYNKFENH